METFSFIGDVVGRAWSFLAATWWVVAPFILIFICIEAYKHYTRIRYLNGLKWTLLEITPPPDVVKSPKIAENFFAGLHAVDPGPINWKKKFFEGKVPDWFSFEIVGFAGGMRFFIRCPEGLRNLVESHLFAQYPDAEIAVAQDYVDALPATLPNDEFDLFGAELMFTKEDAYPIRTYPDFEEEGGKDEFRRSDPLAPLAEITSTLLPGEHLWLQLVVHPVGSDWVKEAQGVVDKIVGKEPKGPEKDALRKAVDLIDSLLPGGTAAEEKKDKAEFSLQKLTPGQKFVLEKIEDKIMKLAYKGGYRFVYVARKDVFNRARVSSVTGMFKQLYSNQLNTFKPNSEVSTFSKGILPWLFPSDRGFGAAQDEYERKVALFKAYKIRSLVHKPVILNTEELATLFHLPGLQIKAPAFPRVEAKKGQPPAGLPTQ